ncbi:thioredoxin family protein [Rhodococcus opacus]|uniref:thioredoxin family protein n=1 Tax=Rhodococcus opacus TaxID=37919 RepID=UPI001E5337C5|nr:thioredoxin domain-containing protein [Rhodococcus opacus]
MITAHAASRSEVHHSTGHYPTFEGASDRHDNVVFGKVDTEAEQQLAAVARITSIPTVVAFHKGALVYSQSGVLPKAALDSLVWRIKELDSAPTARTH